MNSHVSELEKLRTALRAMPRGDLPVIAERALELVPEVSLTSLLGDFVRVYGVENASLRPAPLLEEVQKFHADSLAGRYYQDFAVNSRNFMETSKGTDAFRPSSTDWCTDAFALPTPRHEVHPANLQPARPSRIQPLRLTAPALHASHRERRQADQPKPPAQCPGDASASSSAPTPSAHPVGVRRRPPPTAPSHPYRVSMSKPLDPAPQRNTVAGVPNSSVPKLQ